MLSDGQFSYNGFLFGAGTPYGIQRLEGLEDLKVRSGERVLPRGHGSVPVPHFAASKDIVLELVAADDPELLAAQTAALRAAFTVTDTPAELIWKRRGRPERLIRCRPIEAQQPEEYRGFDVRAGIKLALRADDPRIYSTELRQGLMVRYNPSAGGSDYPVDYAKEWAAPAGVIVATNAGSTSAYPLLRFYGPTDGGTVTSVMVRNVTTGQTLTVAASIAAGQTLTVDNEAYVTGAPRQVVALDGSTRYGSWQQPRTPLALPPGDSVLRYEVGGTSTATRCVATWRDTWLP